jgi:hypothetical protein
MENPVEEIAKVVEILAGAASPDTQAAAFERYFTPDASFSHPICRVSSSPQSRTYILGIYQWYRIMSPALEIHVNHVTYDRDLDMLILDATQKFKIRLNPFGAMPANLIVRLHLKRGTDGRYRIKQQEDFYHPDAFIAMLMPPLVPIVKLALGFGALSSNFNARIGQTLGFWKPKKYVEMQGLR